MWRLYVVRNGAPDSRIAIGRDVAAEAMRAISAGRSSWGRLVRDQPGRQRRAAAIGYRRKFAGPPPTSGTACARGS